MISELKITMSTFSAENQKGPGVISSVAKGGTMGLLNTPLFGTVTTKQGHRIVQLATTFTF